MNFFRITLSVMLWAFPWSIRRFLLNKLFGYHIAKRAYIGFSIVLPLKLVMDDESRIGHLNFCKGVNELVLGKSSRIGNLNWISGFPKGNKDFFGHRKSREPSLIIGNHSAITHRHLIDCTDKITIGEFTTVAGNRSQLLTHAVNIFEARQDCSPIMVGSYCFIGTASVLLPGSAIGNYCVLGAYSLLNHNFAENYSLYGGVPARFIKELPKDSLYFVRETGFIH